VKVNRETDGKSEPQRLTWKSFGINKMCVNLLVGINAVNQSLSLENLECASLGTGHFRTLGRSRVTAHLPNQKSSRSVGIGQIVAPKTSCWPLRRAQMRELLKTNTPYGWSVG
jgi:hypothetical protein